MKKVKNHNSLKPFLIIIGCIGLVFLVAVFVVYSSYFPGSVSTEHARWGAFGDFVGGTLNPIFSFLAFIALLVMINLQSKELRNSNIELSASREELKLTRFAAENQSEHYSMQSKKEDHQKIIEIIDVKLTIKMNTELPDSISKQLITTGLRAFGYYQDRKKRTFKDILTSGSWKMPKNSQFSTLSTSDENEYLILIKSITVTYLNIVNYLNSYREDFGYSVYFSYYQQKYQRLSDYLLKNELIKDDDIIILETSRGS